MINIILDTLKNSNYGMIDKEEISYFPEKFPFTEKEFDDFFFDLRDKYEDHQEDCSNIFGEYKLYFQHNDIKFIHRILIGQGSAYQLLLPNTIDIKFTEKKKIIL